mmetsp:Transcript_15719/g.23142  ORF Transcript_15719/g.23142 Transcript_15719/m.23142 type:complete len:213 (-) Transcript_15719:409-1047(-)
MVSSNGPGNNPDPVPDPISALVIKLGSATVRESDGPGGVSAPFKAKQGPIGPLCGQKITGSSIMSFAISGKVEVGSIVTFSPMAVSGATGSGVGAGVPGSVVGAPVGFAVQAVIADTKLFVTGVEVTLVHFSSSVKVSQSEKYAGTASGSPPKILFAAVAVLSSHISPRKQGFRHPVLSTTDAQYLYPPMWFVEYSCRRGSPFASANISTRT